MIKAVLRVFGVLLAVVALTSADPPRYGNVSLTIWRSSSGAADLAVHMDAPLFSGLSDSWISERAVFDLREPDPGEKVWFKEGLGFRLAVSAGKELRLRVFVGEREWFETICRHSMSVKHIFYGPENRAYLIELSYIAADHVIGLLPPPRFFRKK